MNPTDANPEAVFFADWLLPLSQANLRRRVAYLKREGDAESFWEPVVSRGGGVQRLAPDARDVPALLSALDQYWERADTTGLRRLTPELRKLTRAMAKAASVPRDDGVVAEFVYPLY